jgi:hypothetical protein
MRSFVSILIFLAAALFFWRCDKLDREEPVPAYIYIPSLTFYEDTTGSLKPGSHKIQDVWVTAGNTYLGAYELPAMIPVLEKGTKHILVRAGVLENGIGATRSPYPFYTTFEADVDLKDKQIDTLKPVFTYDFANTHFDWEEKFESGLISLAPTSRNTAKYNVTTHPDSVFQGTGSLHAFLDDSSSFLELNTTGTFVLPRGQAVWLEVNYKTDAPIEFGFLSITGSGAVQHFVGGVNPSSEWKKIYFNFTNQVSAQPSSNTFRLYILSSKPNDKTVAHILLDNIKLLHLE